MFKRTLNLITDKLYKQGETLIESSVLFKLPRWQKRLLMMSVDIVLLPLAVWLAFSLRLGTISPTIEKSPYLIEIVMLLSIIISIPIFIKFGLYRAIIRYIGGQAIVATLNAVVVASVILFLAIHLFDLSFVPTSFLPIYAGTAFLFIGGTRYAARYYYRLANDKLQQKTPIAIYGAGESGRQLATILTAGKQYLPVFYLDDDKNLHNNIVHGMQVYSPKQLPALIEKFHIKQVLLAMPSANIERRRQIINVLEKIPIHVRTTPDFSEIVSGKSHIDDLRDISIEDILGRDPIAPYDHLLTLNIRNRRVMVTGAGGSIGSELCRQIIKLQPSRLVLFEISEFALYCVEKELNECIAQENTQITLVPILGSVQDKQRIEEVLRNYKVQTVYHAAAYKHVPMVEFNPIEGIRNNTLGTYHAAQAAINTGVEHFVLISTDKAVRPTNVMGASKRLCELVIQGFSQLPSNTTFCMVRFGNVLGSSGSVVPLFRRQIKEGGPITVTHPDIIRYFMTIPEAAQLVIQAGAMAKGGEVFLLDMGEPVKIIDLAKRMVRLAGLKIRDNANPNGDIALKFTGLRPGEKLYEELLIGNNSEATNHPKIFKAHEAKLSWQETTELLAQLEQACEKRNTQNVYLLLTQYVSGYSHKQDSVTISHTNLIKLNDNILLTH